jgi:hypothetical protein
MRALRLIFILLLVPLSGCLEPPGDAADTPTTPTEVLQARNVKSDFMPLSPGNHWTYDWEFRTQVIPEGGAPEPPVMERGTIDIAHVEYRSIGDREYVLERETYSGEFGANERLRPWAGLTPPKRWRPPCGPSRRSPLPIRVESHYTNVQVTDIL